MSFVSEIAAHVVLLDGGLATRLEARGHDLSDSLWSARLLLEQPQEVRAAHADFFAAGARVAITASYQLSETGLRAAGRDTGALEPALRRTLEARFLNSPITPQPPGTAQRSLREELQQHWKPYLRQQLADAQTAQQHIDTDSEYRRLNAACQGEIREKLRP